MPVGVDVERLRGVVVGKQHGRGEHALVFFSRRLHRLLKPREIVAGLVEARVERRDEDRLDEARDGLRDGVSARNERARGVEVDYGLARVGVDDQSI